MHVKFVSVTQSHVEGVTTAEELLVYIARVSNPSNQMNLESASKLIAYLIKHKHWSPFDMVNLCVEVKTSRAIAQQILRHWSIKPQEFSQRYAEVVEIEPVEIRKQAEKNRQSSVEVFDPLLDGGDGDNSPTLTSFIIDAHFKECQRLYKELLSKGVAKESARMVLPLATSTTLYLNGSVRSWIHYLEQRTDAHAQLEHQQVAKQIEQIFAANFPETFNALSYD